MPWGCGLSSSSQKALSRLFLVAVGLLSCPTDGSVAVWLWAGHLTVPWVTVLVCRVGWRQDLPRGRSGTYLTGAAHLMAQPSGLTSEGATAALTAGPVALSPCQAV